MHWHALETICPTRADFVAESSRLLADLIVSTLSKQPYFVLALSGGSTPAPVYAELAIMLPDLIETENFPEEKELLVCLVDERHVPIFSADSNTKLVSESFLAKLPSNVVPNFKVTPLFPNCNLPLDACVGDYARRMGDALTRCGGWIDCAVMGMGPDFHTASLFPPVPLDLLNNTRTVIHTETDRFAVRDRVTLSLRTLQRARRCLFLLCGKEKRDLWVSIRAEYEKAQHMTEELASAYPVLGLMSTQVLACFSEE